MAHGVAGFILALEQADAVFGLPFRSGLRRAARDILWRERFDGPRRSAWSMWSSSSGMTDVDAHGWCHGAPGIALAMLWASQFRTSEDYDLLCQRALGATAAVANGRDSFCCGTIGCAQVLLDAFRRTGDPRWQREAERIADTIPERVLGLRSLARGFHQGALGRRYLAARMRTPGLPLPALGFGSIGGVTSVAPGTKRP
jgi:lantibiotic modifying enzyme